MHINFIRLYIIDKCNIVMTWKDAEWAFNTGIFYLRLKCMSRIYTCLCIHVWVVMYVCEHECVLVWCKLARHGPWPLVSLCRYHWKGHSLTHTQDCLKMDIKVDIYFTRSKYLQSVLITILRFSVPILIVFFTVCVWFLPVYCVF